MVVVDFCALGQRTCKRLTTKGQCESDVCPVVARQQRAARPVTIGARIADPIDVDMPNFC